MFTIKLLAKFLSILNKEGSPRAVAAGMALGAIMGLTPFWSLHNLLVLIIVFMTRVNVGAAFFSLGFFSIIAYLIDPLSNRIGYFLLVQAEGLKSLWTALYNTPFVPWTNFNNTLTLGSLVLSLVLLWPLYLLLLRGVVHYRAKIMPKVMEWKIMKIFTASSLYQWYRRFV